PEGGHVHEGFAHAFAEVWPGLEPALKQKEGHRFVYTGHSLGAALATLLASRHKQGLLYTYGSPRVGGPAFIATLNGIEGRRYLDCCDIVGRVPLRTMGYAHFGEPHYIDRKRRIKFDPGIVFRLYDRVIASAEYVFKYARIGNVPARNLADHSPVN